MYEDWISRLAGPVPDDRRGLCDELAGIGRARAALDAREARNEEAREALRASFAFVGSPPLSISLSESICWPGGGDRPPEPVDPQGWPRSCFT